MVLEGLNKRKLKFMFINIFDENSRFSSNYSNYIEFIKNHFIDEEMAHFSFKLCMEIE